MCVSASVCERVCVCVCVCVYTYRLYNTHMYLYTNTHTYVNIHMCVCVLCTGNIRMVSFFSVFLFFFLLSFSNRMVQIDVEATLNCNIKLS